MSARRSSLHLAPLAQFESMPDDGFVRQPVVEALFAISASTVWRRVKDGSLPKPRKTSPGVTAWRVGDLRASLRAH